MSPAQLSALEEKAGTSSSSSSTLTKGQFAMCGAIAGAIGGTTTTPMDVAKTRIMLAEVRILFLLSFKLPVSALA